MAIDRHHATFFAQFVGCNQHRSPDADSGPRYAWIEGRGFSRTVKQFNCLSSRGRRDRDCSLPSLKVLGL